MDVLLQKPKGSIKNWAIAGIILIILFYVCYIFIDMYNYESYGDQLISLDYIGLFINFNGVFTTTLLAFFIGLFVSKNKAYFTKFMLWALMLTGFYFGMQGLSFVVQFFFTYSGLSLMYYLGMRLPQVLVCVLLVSAILQKDSENKGITNMIAWTSIVVNIILIVFQFVTLFSSPDSFATAQNVIIGIASAVAIGVITCLDFVFLAATKSASAGKKQKEETLDNLVEKIAAEPKQENPEDLVEKIDRGDD